MTPRQAARPDPRPSPAGAEGPSPAPEDDGGTTGNPAHAEELAALGQAAPGAPQPAEPPAAAGAPKLPATSASQRFGELPRVLQSLAITLAIAVFVITFIVQAFQIPSESMENTLLIGDYLLVDKVHFARGGVWGEILPYEPIQRGDIVVFRYPVDPRQHFVKRVIGLPGDRIHMQHKQLFRNERPVEEGYAVYRSDEPDAYRDDFPRLDVLNANVTSRWWARLPHLVQGGELVVPPGEYFVLGDNRDESLDSRYWGLVPRENIIGRPLLIYWSLRHTRRIGLLASSRGSQQAPPSHLLGLGHAGDKLICFGYELRHFFQQARWGRALRVIN